MKTSKKINKKIIKTIKNKRTARHSKLQKNHGGGLFLSKEEREKKEKRKKREMLEKLYLNNLFCFVLTQLGKSEKYYSKKDIEYIEKKQIKIEKNKKNPYTFYIFSELELAEKDHVNFKSLKLRQSKIQYIIDNLAPVFYNKDMMMELEKLEKPDTTNEEKSRINQKKVKYDQRITSKQLTEYNKKSDPIYYDTISLCHDRVLFIDPDQINSEDVIDSINKELDLLFKNLEKERYLEDEAIETQLLILSKLVKNLNYYYGNLFNICPNITYLYHPDKSKWSNNQINIDKQCIELDKKIKEVENITMQ